ncbi:MAG: two-component system sensor histidine kinase/response regulator [Sphingobacteriales bacterium]|jgi:two-component system sensor histidine kinase/response regulator
MKELIQNLLQYSRVGTKKLELEEFNPEEVIETVKTDLEELALEKNGSITFNKLPGIKADKIQFSQLIQNLVASALKFSKEEVKPRIEIKYIAEEEFHHFVVVDNGIDEKYKDRVFEIFLRLHARD